MRDIVEKIREIEEEQKKRVAEDRLAKYNTGRKRHLKQIAFHKCKKRNRWVFGGNRSGKTECGAAECVYFARGIHPYRKNRKDTIGWVVSLSTQVQRDVAQKKILSYLRRSDSSRVCVTTIRVIPCKSRISLETRCAVCASSAAVTSSASRTEDFLSRLRAMEILCFSPPESPLPCPSAVELSTRESDSASRLPKPQTPQGKKSEYFYKRTEPAAVSRAVFYKMRPYFLLIHLLFRFRQHNSPCCHSLFDRFSSLFTLSHIFVSSALSREQIVFRTPSAAVAPMSSYALADSSHGTKRIAAAL